MSAVMIPACDLPSDPALPGLDRVAAPDRMLEIVREHLTDVPEREGWKTCALREAVYQPRRACRIAYALGRDDSEREEIMYARWDAADRPHRSATSISADGSQFEVFRYPRDRRMRQIRSMQRNEWLRRASENWFREWLGEGSFAGGDWRCSPIKYVPESRLVCRLKGLWLSTGGEHWQRAYVRVARRNDARFQFDTLRAIANSFEARRTGLTVPRALGCLSDVHLLATEFIRGRTLREAAGEGDVATLADACRKLACAAESGATLPNSTGETTETLPPREMLSDLASGIPALRSLCAALEEWASHSPVSPRARGLVHGDLHGGQIILKGDRMCIVDWDRASIGDATQDITNLAAECASKRWLNDNSSTEIPPDSAAICVEAWRSAGGAWTADAARWWTTRALVLRAWGLMRHLRPGWPRSARKLLDRAFRVYDSGADWLG